MTDFDTLTRVRYERVAELEAAAAERAGRATTVPAVMARNLFTAASDADMVGRRNAEAATLQSMIPFASFGDHDLVPRRLADGKLFVAATPDVDMMAVENLVYSLRAAGFEIDSEQPDGNAGASEEDAGDDVSSQPASKDAEELDAASISDAAMSTGVDAVEIEYLSKQEIQELLSSFQRPSPERIAERAAAFAADPEQQSGALLQLLADIWAEALDCGASDIDFCFLPGSDRNWVAFHVHGERDLRHLLPEATMGALVALVKRQANCRDYSVREKIQSGRLSVPWQGRTIDVRVGTGPGEPDGEEVSVRLLDLAKLPPFRSLMRHMPEVRDELYRLIRSPTKTSGLVMVSGPTGQGKTTTIASIETAYDRVSRKVIEIANPPEYLVPYVWSEDAHGRDGRRVADHIAGALRRTPFALVIQEVRTEEDGDAAAQAVDSGHLTYLTIHAGNAPQTIQRFVERLGDDHQKVAHAIVGEHLRVVINQRLVRTLCHVCRVKSKSARSAFPAAHLARMGLRNRTELFEQMDGGCRYCRHTGIGGLALAAETLIMPREPELKSNIIRLIQDRKFDEVPNAEGVIFVPRAQRVGRLLEEGLIGISTAQDLLAVG